MNRSMRAGAIVALMVVDARRMLMRGSIGLLPAAVLLAPGVIASHNAIRALYRYSVTWLGLGTLLVPMILVADRQRGVLDFYSGLPLSRNELAIARLALSVASATAGSALFVANLVVAFHFDGKTFPVTVAVAAANGLAAAMFVVSGLLAPLFARLPALLAAAIPAGLAFAFLPEIRQGGLLTWLAKTVGPLAGADVRSAKLALYIALAWLAAAVLAGFYVWTLGIVLQPRVESTRRVDALLSQPTPYHDEST